MFGKRVPLTHCEIVNVNKQLHILWSWDQQKGLIFEPLQALLFATLCAHCKDPEPNFTMAQRIYDCKLVERNRRCQWQCVHDQKIQCTFGENALELDCEKVRLKLECRQLNNLAVALNTLYEQIQAEKAKAEESRQILQYQSVILSPDPTFSNSQAEPPAPALVLA